MDPTPPRELATTLDLERRQRCGFPEVIFGPGKTITQLCAIVATLLEHGEPVLATRIDPLQTAVLLNAVPERRYDDVGRTFRIDEDKGKAGKQLTTGSVSVISAGTGDLPVT